MRYPIKKSQRYMRDIALGLKSKWRNHQSMVCKGDLMALCLVGKSSRKCCLEENSGQHSGRKSCTSHFADQSTLSMVNGIQYTHHPCYCKIQLGISKYSYFCIRLGRRLPCYKSSTRFILSKSGITSGITSISKRSRQKCHLDNYSHKLNTLC